MPSIIRVTNTFQERLVIKMKTLLIVDDEVSLRKGLIDTINWNKFGYQILGEASNGDEAIQLIKENKPDIVLTDIVMPKLNGIELTKYLSKFYPEIAILVLSNYSDFDYVKETLIAGARDYLLKATISEKTIIDSLDKIIIKKTHEESYLTLSDLIRKVLNQELSEKEQRYLTNQLRYPKCYLIVSDLFTLTTQNQLDFKVFVKNNLKDTFIFSNQVQTQQIYLLNTHYTQQQILTFFNQKKINFPFFGCLSEELTSFKDLKAKIEELSLKLNLRFNSKNKQLVLTNDAFIFENLPLFPMDDFQTALSHFNEKIALDMTQSYLDKSASLTLEETKIKNSLIGIFYQIYTHFGDHYPMFADVNLEKSKLLSDLTSPLTFEALLIETQSKLDDFKTYLDNQENNQDTLFKSRLIDYVNEHAGEKISLKEVANHFHFNYSYFSSYFSRLFDMSFIDFLTQIRINKAKELLANETLNISEIALATGFSEISYFSKVFKKQTGTSPTLYRRKWR